MQVQNENQNNNRANAEADLLTQFANNDQAADRSGDAQQTTQSILEDAAQHSYLDGP